LATPVAYPMSKVPEAWRTIYALNPMVSVVEGFRWALTGSQPMSGTLLLISSSIVGLVLVTGAFYFRRMERTFADVV
jgi:lipopolysaccharide transport system permease protein